MLIMQAPPQAPSFSPQDNSPKSDATITPSFEALGQLGDFANQVQQKFCSYEKSFMLLLWLH